MNAICAVLGHVPVAEFGGGMDLEKCGRCNDPLRVMRIYSYDVNRRNGFPYGKTAWIRFCLAAGYAEAVGEEERWERAYRHRRRYARQARG